MEVSNLYFKSLMGNKWMKEIIEDTPRFTKSGRDNKWG